MAADGEPKTPFPPTDDLVFFSGCFCCFNALYTDMPACVGCAVVEECLCCKQECCASVAGMKNPYPVGLGEKQDGDIINIALYCCSCTLMKPQTCCKTKGQQCCCVGAGSIPCNSDVPSVCGACFIACVPSVAVGKKMSEITNSKGSPEAPTDVEMVR